jgi:hypothetical protein
VRFEYVNVEGRTFEALSEHAGVPATPFGVAYFREHRDEIRRASEESLRYASPPQQFELIVRDLMDPIADVLLARSPSPTRATSWWATCSRTRSRRRRRSGVSPRWRWRCSRSTARASTRPQARRTSDGVVATVEAIERGA